MRASTAGSGAARSAASSAPASRAAAPAASSSPPASRMHGTRDAARSRRRTGSAPPRLLGADQHETRLRRRRPGGKAFEQRVGLLVQAAGKPVLREKGAEAF